MLALANFGAHNLQRDFHIVNVISTMYGKKQQNMFISFWVTKIFSRHHQNTQTLGLTASTWDKGIAGLCKRLMDMVYSGLICMFCAPCWGDGADKTVLAARATSSPPLSSSVIFQVMRPSAVCVLHSRTALRMLRKPETSWQSVVFLFICLWHAWEIQHFLKMHRKNESIYTVGIPPNFSS